MIKTFKEGLFYKVILPFSLAVISCAYDVGGVTTAKEPQPDISITIDTGDSIKVDMNNASLHDALNAVTQKSKISFEVPETLKKDKITLRFICKDWPEAIKRMLKKYNIAYGWDNNELKKVFIFERGTGKVLQLIPTPENERPQIDPTGSNQHDNDGIMDEQAIPPLPPIPIEEEKILKIKRGSQKPGSRKKQPGIDYKKENIIIELPPEPPPGLSGKDSSNASDFLIPDEPEQIEAK